MTAASETCAIVPIDVEDIMAKLSVSEKMSLIAGVGWWQTKALPKYGIPSLRLSDGPNGVRGTRFFNSIPSACFPCGTALGSTFDADLLYQAGSLMADEAKAKGAHVILGPTVNMQRGPLGGRGFESIGEDPVLAGLLAAAMIKGMQGQGIAATIKHFVCNDQEHERNKADSIVSQRALRELYLMPFQLAIREAAPKAIMTSYNRVNGVHCSEDPKLMRDILRQEWGWKGLIMSDWYGTYSTTNAINAGLDLEMPGPTRFRGEGGVHAASSGKFFHDALDNRVREVLHLVNYCAGSGVPENAPEETRDLPGTRKLLRRLASESVVLLKNEGQLLPLSKDKKVLVIGPNGATANYCGGGSASLRPYYAVSPLEGVISKIGHDNVEYTVGSYSHKELPNLGFDWSTSADLSRKGVVFTAFTEPPNVENREPVESILFEDAKMMFLDYEHEKIRSKLWYANIEGYLVPDHDGDYTFGVSVYGSAKVFLNEKPIIDLTEHQKQGSAFFGLGTEEVRIDVPLKRGTLYHVRLEFASAPTSKTCPNVVAFGGGAVRIGGAWVIDAIDEINKAVAMAKEADQVVICAGLNMDWESEGYDRSDMQLPPGTDDLINAVCEANANTVVVIQSGTPVEMPWLDNVRGLLHAWYGGNETGNGIADILFGDVNPSAKLSLTFPVRNEDNPAFVNFCSEAGRILYGEDIFIGYRWYDTVKRPVNFPFGHGLSYTSFVFEDLTLHIDSEVLRVTVEIANTGTRDGAEVVQAYISSNEHNPSLRRAVKELKGFEKVFLKRGETASCSISIPVKYACSYFDEICNEWVCPNGQYTLTICNSSALDNGNALTQKFSIEKMLRWRGI